MKFYEVQQYFTEVNYQFHPDPFYVNATWWNSLPEEFQTIITDCATEMGTYNDQLIDETSQAASDEIEASGAEIYVPTEEELALSRKPSSPSMTPAWPRASAPRKRSPRCRRSWPTPADPVFDPHRR